MASGSLRGESVAGLFILSAGTGDDKRTENLSNLIEQGFDVVVSAPAPGVWKTLMKRAFSEFTNWAKSTRWRVLGGSAACDQLRDSVDFWGENPGLQLGDLKTLGKTGYDGNNLRNMNTLAGAQIDWQLEEIPEINRLIPYQYQRLRNSIGTISASSISAGS